MAVNPTHVRRADKWFAAAERPRRGKTDHAAAVACAERGWRDKDGKKVTRADWESELRYKGTFTL